MIKWLLMLRHYSKRFGLIKGIQIYLKIKWKKTDNISFKDVAHPISLRSDTSDVPTFLKIFLRKEYQIRHDFDPKVIIDAGANIGLSAIFYSNRYPKSEIISIEPEESNYDLLVKNTQKYENIIPLKMAISNVSNQELAVLDNGYGKWGFMTGELIDNTEKEISSVKSITIDEIMNNYDYKILDIVKIDIEGYEKELFESNYNLWLPHVRCLIIELHDRMKEGCSKSFFNAISKYDFSFYRRGENLIFLNTKLMSRN